MDGNLERTLRQESKTYTILAIEVSDVIFLVQVRCGEEMRDVG